MRGQEQEGGLGVGGWGGGQSRRLIGSSAATLDPSDPIAGV